MPELPEVETVRRSLLPQIKGKSIAQIVIPYLPIVVGDAAQFISSLQGETFLDVERKGKYLIFRFTNNKTVVSHLRMEGKYHLVPADTKIDKHEHLIYKLTDGSDLRYADVRKFGRLQLVETGTEAVATGISKLGPEPNSTEFSFNYFAEGLKKRKKNIKNVLLDQSLVTGLGNIYVDEVLWLSKINPLIEAKQISESAARKLYDAINDEIKLAIENHGTTVFTYLDASGHAGSMQNHLHAYSHGGEPCERCGTTMEKIKVNGRGTVFCPKCQVR